MFSVFKLYQVKQWGKFDIKIIEKKLLYKNTFEIARTEVFKPFIKYQYEVNHKKYISTRLAFDDECIIEKVILNYPYERENNPPSYELLNQLLTIKTVFVNPKKPEESFLIHTLSNNRKNYYLLMITYAIILILFPLYNIG